MTLLFFAQRTLPLKILGEAKSLQIFHLWAKPPRVKRSHKQMDETEVPSEPKKGFISQAKRKKKSWLHKHVVRLLKARSGKRIFICRDSVLQEISRTSYFSTTALFPDPGREERAAGKGHKGGAGGERQPRWGGRKSREGKTCRGLQPPVALGTPEDWNRRGPEAPKSSLRSAPRPWRCFRTGERRAGWPRPKEAREQPWGARPAGVPERCWYPGTRFSCRHGITRVGLCAGVCQGLVCMAPRAWDGGEVVYTGWWIFVCADVGSVSLRVCVRIWVACK